jgi:hypothetical protein
MLKLVKLLSAGIKYLPRFGAIDYDFCSGKFTSVKNVAKHIARRLN